MKKILVCALLDFVVHNIIHANAGQKVAGSSVVNDLSGALAHARAVFMNGGFNLQVQHPQS